jgi:hypothetical protein
MVLGDVLMDYVYVLQHSYEWEHEGEFIEETKMIGVYATHENAERVIEYYIRLPGFNKHPIDCFHIDKYELNQNNWTHGFGFDD